MSVPARVTDSPLVFTCAAHRAAKPSALPVWDAQSTVTPTVAVGADGFAASGSADVATDDNAVVGSHTPTSLGRRLPRLAHAQGPELSHARFAIN